MANHSHTLIRAGPAVAGRTHAACDWQAGGEIASSAWRQPPRQKHASVEPAKNMPCQVTPPPPPRLSPSNTTPRFPLRSKTCTRARLPACVPTLARAYILHRSLSLLHVSHAPSYTTARQHGALWPPTALRAHVYVSLRLCVRVAGGMGFKQTGNGGCHTRESGIDCCLLLCALQERTGAIMNIIHSQSFTTQALSDESEIAQVRERSLQLFFAAGKYFTLSRSHRCESTPVSRLGFRFSPNCLSSLKHLKIKVQKSITEMRRYQGGMIGIYKNAVTAWWRQ